MRVSTNHSNAAHDAIMPHINIVPAATVWVPSTVSGASAGRHPVRTLRPSGRTQGLALGEGLIGPREVKKIHDSWQDRALDRREAFMTYALGGLFGLCIVGAAVFQSGNEGTTAFPGSVGADTTGESVAVSPR